MKKLFAAISMVAMLMLFATTALAHDGAHEEESHGHGMYEEGSGGSAMEMDRKSRAMAHEYKNHGMGGDHSGMKGEHGGEHSKEYYEKKYGKYDHKKHEMMEEGSGIKDEAMQMKDRGHKRMEEGSH